MGRKWIQAALLIVIVAVLTACSQSVEDQALAGIENAETVFSSEPKEVNKSIGHIELYLPAGYSIEKGIDELNYTILNGKDSYILFVNQNETNDSQLHYDIFKSESTGKIVEEKTFKSDDLFGFSGVVEQSKGKYELIANLGGVKLSTISEDKKLDTKIQEMMEIVQTVNVID
ncbi:hypothetical protein [Solibacillus merdavium]|uniref:DUF4367 domain-containing protein n=1 Tax=Solibacillus merdavium TaxID=2762218 RepID=A0ABR8XRX7_9BACL|nr:hypothetical protein [Solibacillus merdavium]MBD8034701.1 hypothetical protein [Solibacillus merdavium]